MNNTYDVIVVGLGGMGSATACELSRRGAQVLGLEQFQPGHDQGSSHGHTRIIRTAYYEHPDYVPLIRRAFGCWYTLEQEQGCHLLTECPVLTIGKSDSPVLVGVRASAEQHALPMENLSAAELRARFPIFHFDEEYVGALEGSSGILLVDDCVQAFWRQAQANGATLLSGECVLGWEASDREVVVWTETHRYRAGSLVLTAGPWAGDLLGSLGISLTLMRQVVVWFTPQEPTRFRRDVFPVMLTDTSNGAFYAIPMLDPRGVKVAQHYGGQTASDPAQIERSVLDEDESTVRHFLRAHIPTVDGPRQGASVCIYTLTPDHHFLIDRAPGQENVVLAAGLSGHGFKFAPVVGEALADLVDTGKTELPINMFRLDRFDQQEPGT